MFAPTRNDWGVAMVDFLTRSTWSALDRLAGLLALLGLLALMFAGKIEGAIAPVADDFEVERTVWTLDGGVRVWGDMVIERPSCSFIRLEWYLVGQSRDVLVPVKFEEGTKLRDGGVAEWGPWLVDLPEYGLNQSRVIVFHQCPYRPWLTETHLFP
jgi:hypothetical protein